MMSLEFAFIVTFCVVCFTRASGYMAVIQPYFTGDTFSHYPSEQRELYVNIASLMIPFGALYAPVIEPVVNKLGFAYHSVYVMIFGAVWSLLAMVDSLNVQLIGAFVFTYYRANVFAFPGIFNLYVFGAANLGVINGVMYTLAAPCNYAITPALNYALTGKWDALWLILTGVLVVPFLLALVLKCVSKDKLVQPNFGQDGSEAKYMHVVSSSEQDELTQNLVSAAEP